MLSVTVSKAAARRGTDCRRAPAGVGGEEELSRSAVASRTPAGPAAAAAQKAPGGLTARRRLGYKRRQRRR